MNEAIVSKAMRGSRAALTELCKSTAKSILFRVRRFLPNDADAEDVSQEVLIRMCERIHALRDSRAFEAWLNAIILNEVRRFTKQAATHSNILHLDDYLESVADEETEPLPLDYVLTKEESAIILSIVDQLPLRQKEAVLLHYYRDLSVSVTAEVMGVSQPGVSRYLKLSREKIKNALRERSEQEKLAGERGSVAFRALAALPMGSLLSEALTLEAAQIGTATDAWAERVLATKAPRARIRRVFVAALALIAVIAAVSVPLVTSGIAAPVTTSFERQVVFSGGSAEYGHVNPESATVEVNDNGSTLTVLNWTIAEAKSDVVLLSGEGSRVEGPFDQLSDGTYIITFALTDEAGREYTSYGYFQILESG